MPRDVVHITRQMPHSADAVWTVLGAFDNGWHPFIAECTLLRSPEGALLRRFTDTDGQSYQERRTYLSETDRVLCYQMDHGIDGAQSYTARIEVTPDGEGCVVSWRAHIVASAARIAAVCDGTKAVFEAALDAAAGLPRIKPLARPALVTTGEAAGPLVLDGIPTLEVLASEVDNEDSDTLVLFLHGIGGQATNWAAQLNALRGSYQVAALNLRGYGNSSLGFHQTQIDDYCSDILQVQESIGASRLVLVGLSLGSWIATSFAMRHPDRLAGLVLAGGCTGMSEADPRERESFRVSRVVPMDAGQTPADFAPAVVDIIAGPNASDTSRKEMLQSMSAIPSETYRDALNCFCNPLEQFDFGKIDCPVLLFTGAHDKLAPPAEIQRVSERIADAQAQSGRSGDVQFEVIADAGHICNIEAPEAVSGLLHRFLSRLPGVARNYKSSRLERQEEKRARIRAAAHDEFCENGFDGASMDRIAEGAAVSKPTLYQYFGGKEGLLEAVLDAGRSQIVAPLMAEDGPLVERLWRFSWVYADFVLRPDMLSLARLILGEAARRPENAIAYHQQGPQRAFEGLVEFVAEAVAAGELQTDAPELAAQNLWSLILSGPRDHYLHHVDQRPSEAELLRSIGHGLTVFLRAYATAPEARVAELQTFISAKTENLKQQGQTQCQTEQQTAS